MLYRMGGRAYHTVVQRQSEPIFLGEMCIDNIRGGAIGLTQIAEQQLRVRGKIVCFADGIERGVCQVLRFFIVAENGATDARLLLL